MTHKESRIETQRAQPTQGRTVEVAKGQSNAHVRIDIGNGVIVTSSITNEVVDDPALAAGDAFAAIKAFGAMIGK